MKKGLYILLALVLILPAIGLAESIEMEGSIEASHTIALLAPYGGVLDDVQVKPGDVLEAGEPLMRISSTGIYADFDGKVTSVFAEAGDSAEAILSRYGALCYIELDAILKANCSIVGASSENESKIVHSGEVVSVRSTKDSDDRGTGTITTVADGRYVVEVTDIGDLAYDDHVRIYREDGYANGKCIGTGDLSRVEPVAVTAPGYVLSVHVKAGQTVSRGDLLFEVVTDPLHGREGGDGTVSMPEDGVVLSVSAASGTRTTQDAPLITYCPMNDVRLVCTVDEDDLSQIHIGDSVTVTLDAYPDETQRGTITAISGVGADTGSRVQYDVTVELENTENVRVGMSATAEK